MKTLRIWMSVALAMVVGVLGVTRSSPGQCSGGSAGEWLVGPHQRAAGPLGYVATMLNFDPDGAGPEPLSLIAAGSFSISGSRFTNCIAYWNGTDWFPLGSGLSGGIVYALAVYNGELYAGGTFTASGATPCNRLAKWNGVSWQALGAGVNSDVRALAVYNGRLYVGGYFSTAGGLPANGVASWDGATWRTLGTAISGGGVTRSTSNPISYTAHVLAMGVFDSKLFVGGGFDLVNGASGMATLAKWDGTMWTGVGPITHTGSFLPLPEVRSIGVFTSGTIASSTIYIGGDFDTINGVAARFIARYTKTSTGEGPWATVGTGMGGPVDKLLVEGGQVSLSALYASSSRRSGFDPDTWVRATYRFASNTWNQYAPEYAEALAFNSGLCAGVRGCSKRVGAEWMPLGNGLNGTLSRVVPVGADLYAFGTFTVADQQVVNGVARLDGAGWHPVGNGILSPGNTSLTYVYDAAAANGSLFVAGNATSATGQTLARVLRFNGTSWVNTLEFTTNSGMALSSVGSDLYFGSTSVWRWNGLSWVQVGGSVPGGGGVSEVFMWQGVLHCSAGSYIFRLNGSTWVQAFQARNSYYFGPTEVWNGRLFGAMATQGPSSIDELVGGTFTPSFPGGYASDFLAFNNQLLAVQFGGIGIFDGVNWNVSTATGGGSDLAIWGGDLIVAGTSTVNGLPSPLFARLKCCPADFNGSGGVNVQDIFDFLSAWFAANPAADFNHTGGIGVQDIFDFLAAWFSGC